MGWRFEWHKGWGAKRFGFQFGYLLVAVWRKHEENEQW